MDVIAKEIIKATTPLQDSINCLPFIKALYQVNVTGPTILKPGLSYKYIVDLEEPADGLKFSPLALNVETRKPVSDKITFDPQILQFDSFMETTANLYIQVKADTTPGKYEIQLTKTELGTVFYLSVVPFTVQVVSLVDMANDQKPSVNIKEVDVDTIGFPIIVPVTLSQVPSNLMYLQISKLNDPDNVLSISQKRILIETTTLQTQFEILITSNKVPDTIILDFKLTSFYQVVHEVVPQRMFVQFY